MLCYLLEELIKKNIMKKCKYSNCQEPLLPSTKTFNGCCNELHSRLAKQEYNNKYYAKTKFYKKIIKHDYIFKTCIAQFGEDEQIDSSFLEILGIEWDFETGKVFIDNLEYIAVGNYAYILSKNKKVKIKRI